MPASARPAGSWNGSDIMLSTIRVADRPIVWMFAGQGAQYHRMGEAFYRRHPAFRATMDRLDRVVVEALGLSVVAALYGSDRRIADQFDQLHLSQPALFMVQLAMAEVLRADGLPEPDLLLGLSLGEFISAAVAGSAPAETILRELIKQAQLFREQAAPGAMLMVLDHVSTFETDPIYRGRAELAGINFDQCFILAGLAADMAAVSRELDARGVPNQILPIAHAFHSAFIDPVEGAFRALAARRDWAEPGIPTVGCSGQAVGRLPDWWRVVREPIRFDRAFRMIDEPYPDAVYIDLGPAGNMKTNCLYCAVNGIADRSFSIMTPYADDMVNLDKLRRTFVLS